MQTETTKTYQLPIISKRSLSDVKFDLIVSAHIYYYNNNHRKNFELIDIIQMQIIQTTEINLQNALIAEIVCRRGIMTKKSALFLQHDKQVRFAAKTATFEASTADERFQEFYGELTPWTLN